MTVPTPKRSRAEGLRAVWAAVTARPDASVRELTAMAGYSSRGNISRMLHELRDRGYIEYVDHEKRARRVLIPFIALPPQEPPA